MSDTVAVKEVTVLLHGYCQSYDRQGAWPHGLTNAARTRRRGD
jgi:hypothetical protein